MELDDRSVILHDVRGFGDEFLLLDGQDQDGNVWLYRRQSGTRSCCICGSDVTDGWVCFQSGDTVCASHVAITGRVQ